MRVFVAGATGFIGRQIVAALAERGDQVIALSREKTRALVRLQEGAEIVEGDPVVPGPWQEHLEGCDAVVNLVGERVDGQRWNARFRQILHDSRVDSTRFIVEGIASIDASVRPRVLVNASGIDYYSLCDDNDIDADDDVTEDSPLGESFMSQLCRDWEAEAREVHALGVRSVLMRTGLVMGRGGGFEKMVKQFKLYAGGTLGSGQQWTSWVHITDAVRAYLFAIDNVSLRGPVNLVAPENARQRELATTLGQALGRPSLLPVPGFAVKAAIGQLADHVLHGRRATPRALRDAGFEFVHSRITDAMAAIDFS